MPTIVPSSYYFSKKLPATASPIMVALGLLAAGRYAGLRPTVPSLAWRALTSQPLTSSTSPTHFPHSRGLKVLAFKEEGTPASSGIKRNIQFRNSQFTSVAAAALKTPIPYSELSIGKHRSFCIIKDRPLLIFSYLLVYY